MKRNEERDFEGALFPILTHDTGLAYLTDVTENDVRPHKWDFGVVFPFRRKRTVDLVAICEDGSMLHIEQETSPSADIASRMLEYAYMLLNRHELQRKLRQILFYTGDAPREWPHAQRQSHHLLEKHQLGSLEFEFAVVDAGAPSRETIARTRFPAAALGLLARDWSQASIIARDLVERIAHLSSPEHRKQAMVYCIRVASLRGWAPLFRGVLEERMPGVEIDSQLRILLKQEAQAFQTAAWTVLKANKNIDFNVAKTMITDQLRYTQYLNVISEGMSLNNLEELRPLVATIDGLDDMDPQPSVTDDTMSEVHSNPSASPFG